MSRIECFGPFAGWTRMASMHVFRSAWKTCGEQQREGRMPKGETTVTVESMSNQKGLFDE